VPPFPPLIGPHLRLFRRSLTPPSLGSALILAFLVLFADGGQEGKLGTAVSDGGVECRLILSRVRTFLLELCSGLRLSQRL
jgi:hypothetical protein